MRLVRENNLRKMFLKANIEWDAAHLLVLEAKGLLLDESLSIDSVVSQLIERELAKAA
jgi:hypothetical protein